jgi:putative glycosyltransferase (TIGR04372 family)
MRTPFQEFLDQASLRFSRQELLQAIGIHFPQLPGLETLQNTYYQFSRGATFDHDLVEYLRVLLRCGRTREAYCLLQAISFAHQAIHVPIELGRRLSILLGMGEERPFPPPPQAPGWIRKYAATLEDSEFETRIDKLAIQDQRLLIEATCPSCGREDVLDAASDLHVKGRFLCPGCLARLTLPPVELKNRLIKMMTSYLDAVPKSPDGKLFPADLEDLLLLVRLYRPLLLVRFGTHWHSIGHMLTQPLEYMRLRRLDSEPTFDIVASPENALNRYAAQFVGRIFDHVSPVGEQVSRLLPESNEHNLRQRLEFPAPQWRCQANNLHLESVPKFGFTPEEIRQGEDGLLAMGIPADAKIVCLHVRTSQYHGDTGSQFRNSDIHLFAPTIRHLADAGYHVVRLGAATGLEPVPHADHPKVIDYANRHRSEFMDVYLNEKCALMIGTSSGIDSTRIVRDMPTLLVNSADHGRLHPMGGSMRAAMKKIWSERLGRYLDPVLAHLLCMESDDNVRELHCRWEDLSAQEILDCTMEYLEYDLGKKPRPQEHLSLERLVFDLTAQTLPSFQWNARHYCHCHLRMHESALLEYARQPDLIRSLVLQHMN